MNAKQRSILVVAAILVAAMLLFPPFRYYFGVTHDGRESNIGYSFILSPPVLDPSRSPQDYPVVANVSWPLLLTQWVGVVLIAGLLCLASKDKEPPSGS